MRHRIRLAGGRFTRLLAKSPTGGHPRRSAADYSAYSRRFYELTDQATVATRTHHRLHFALPFKGMSW
jgi:hypothetical protein